MEVKYNRPTKIEGGLYVFKEPQAPEGLLVIYPFNTAYARVSSPEDYRDKQERIVRATESIVDYLTDFELPDGVEGGAKVIVRLLEAHRSWGIRRTGDMGFPDVIIQTDYGESAAYLWPEQDGDGLHVRAKGGGLADKVLEATKEDLKRIFGDENPELKEIPASEYFGKRTTDIFFPSW